MALVLVGMLFMDCSNNSVPLCVAWSETFMCKIGCFARARTTCMYEAGVANSMQAMPSFLGC